MTYAFISALNWSLFIVETQFLWDLGHTSSPSPFFSFSLDLERDYLNFDVANLGFNVFTGVVIKISCAHYYLLHRRLSFLGTPSRPLSVNVVLFTSVWPAA